MNTLPPCYKNLPRDRKLSGVYVAYQISRHRILYVGSSSDLRRRWKEHHCELEHNRHKNPHLQRLWNKYGLQDIQFLVIEETDRLVEREEFWMSGLKPVCNIAAAADNPLRGRHQSEEARRRIGDSHRGKPLSEEHKKKLSEARRLRPPVTDEFRRKMSLTLIGNKRTLGYKQSEDTCRKKSESMRGHQNTLGKKFSLESRLRMSEAQKRRRANEQALKGGG